MKDSAAGMAAYQRRLRLVMEEDPKEWEKEFAGRGWYIGSKEGKAHLPARSRPERCEEAAP